MERGRIGAGPPPPAPVTAAESFIGHVGYGRGLSREGRGYTLLRRACPVDVAAVVAQSCCGLGPVPDRFPCGWDPFHIMCIHKTVEEIQAAGMDTEKDRQRVDWGGRVTSKNGPSRKILSRVPPDMGAGFEKETEEWMEVLRMAWGLKDEMSNALCAPYARVMGPTFIKSWGVCPEQRTHVDMARPAEMEDDHPSVSFLLTVQDRTELPIWTGSHSRLPSHSGGRMCRVIERITLVLNAGDCLVLRKDLVHAGGASTGPC